MRLTITERSFIIVIVRVKDEKKETAIFAAAISLITANGFADTSMSKIAKAADVSPATIYIYFENKEDMLNKTYTHVKREIAAALGKGLQPKLTVEEAFQVIWNNFYKYAVKNSVKFSFTEQFANSPLVDRVHKDEGMSYFQTLFEWFERGKREKVFKDMPAEIFTAFAFAPLIGLVKQHFCGEVVLDTRLLKTVYEITWKAVTR
jgi:TetR/AcrR family transcriptional repressor of multidrug resistance operon